MDRVGRGTGAEPTTAEMRTCYADRMVEIADRLWKGKASVMVGSGFSRMAAAKDLHARPFPLWKDVAVALMAELHPPHSRSARASGEPRAEDVPRLAQEFESARDREALEEHLRKMLPDDEYEPAAAHRNLLQLPWRDVFTTNWDTLLDRAAATAARPVYEVVDDPTSIPGSRSPRVIKLHGSMRSSRPLIVTRKDYLQYEQTNAVFANTVRQAMAETSLVLFGFSGDDPNFLAWTEWILRTLGDHAPRVYLLGFHSQSVTERQMHEDNGISPVDLSVSPKARTWPRDDRHTYATHSLIDTLHNLRPYDETRWPDPPPERLVSIPSDHALQPITPIHEHPAKEPDRSPASNDGNLLKEVVKTVSVWRQNRQSYPGWLAIPSDVRHRIQRCTSDWESAILSALPKMPPLDRLAAVRELLWRYEVCMDPIREELEAAASEILCVIDCEACSIEGNARRSVNWPAVRGEWAEVALSLLTAARYSLNEARFTARLRMLDPLLEDAPSVAHRVHHERCLWDLFSLDYSSLTKLLGNWDTDGTDPVWLMRKSALLSEAGLRRAGDSTIQKAVAQIQRLQRDSKSVSLESREAWALWSLGSIGDYREALRRLRELAPSKCDVAGEVEILRNALRSAGESRATLPPFTLGARVPEVVHHGRALPDTAGYRAFRLPELVGLPPRRDLLALAKEPMVLGLDDLGDGELALRMLLRITDYDKESTLDKLLSRSRVAVLSRGLAQRLVGMCKRMIDDALTRLSDDGKRSVFAAERIRVGLEALSRLVLRLEAADGEAIWSYAQQLYRDERINGDPWFPEALLHLMRRSWKALGPQARRDRILKVLEAPIGGMPGMVCNWDNFADAIDVVPNDQGVPARNRVTTRRWEKIVERLVEGVSLGGTARQRAARRLAFLAPKGILTPDETARVAHALWGELATGGQGLPKQTTVRDFGFLLLPEPSCGMARRRFGEKWLREPGSGNYVSFARNHNRIVGRSDLRPTVIEDVLWEVGMSIPFLNRHGRRLQLTPEEKQTLLKVVERWAKHRHKPMFWAEHEERQASIRAVHGLSWLAFVLKVSDSVGEAIWEKGEWLRARGIPRGRLLPVVAHSGSGRVDDAVAVLGDDLMAHDDDVATSAVGAITIWMMIDSAGVEEALPVPQRLVRGIGDIIERRQGPALSSALATAKWVFETGGEREKEAILPGVLDGLRHLARELAYAGKPKNGGTVDTVPLLRYRCAELTRAMVQDGLGDEAPVSRWLESARTDGLANVRHAVTSRPK